MSKRAKKLFSILTASMLAVTLSCSSFPSTALSAVAGLQTVQAAQEATKKEIKNSLNRKLSDEQLKVLTAALSLEGQICYTWGGKATAPGWNSRWDRGTGLDCSGFVQWAFWTGLGIHDGLGSTAEISTSWKQISKKQLKPGDLGLLFIGGSGYTNVNGKYFATKEEAEASNAKIARKVVMAYIKGTDSSKVPKAKEACKEAAAAYKAYKDALDESSSDTSEAASYKTAAKEAQKAAADLIDKAEAKEKQASEYEEKATASTSETDASQADSLSSEPESVSNTEESADGTSSSTSSAEEYSSKAEELRTEASDLRDQASAYLTEAKEDKSSAQALKSKEQDLTAARKKELKKLKKAYITARDKAIKAETAKYEAEEKTNHVGIYVGTDSNGNDLWVHCNSGDNTVAVNNFSGFTCYVRVISDYHYTLKSKVKTTNDIYKGIRKIDQMILKQELYLGPQVNEAEDLLLEAAREIRSHAVYKKESDL